MTFRILWKFSDRANQNGRRQLPFTVQPNFAGFFFFFFVCVNSKHSTSQHLSICISTKKNYICRWGVIVRVSIALRRLDCLWWHWLTFRRPKWKPSSESSELWNVSGCYKSLVVKTPVNVWLSKRHPVAAQSFSGLHSPGRSCCTDLWYDSCVQTQYSEKSTY